MNVSRRQLLKTIGAGALLAGLPEGWVGGVYAAEGPESPKVRIGIIALTDCSSIVMAHELGFFKKWLSVIGFGLILALLAYGLSFFDKILWLAFKIAGVTFGSLLGVFLLGLLSTRAANRANVVAMVAMALVNLVLLILSETGALPLGWSWLVIWGTAGTIALAWFLGPLLDAAPSPLSSPSPHPASPHRGEEKR